MKNYNWGEKTEGRQRRLQTSKISDWSHPVWPVFFCVSQEEKPSHRKMSLILIVMRRVTQNIHSEDIWNLVIECARNYCPFWSAVAASHDSIPQPVSAKVNCIAWEEAFCQRTLFWISFGHDCTDSYASSPEKTATFLGREVIASSLRKPLHQGSVLIHSTCDCKQNQQCFFLSCSLLKELHRSFVLISVCFYLHRVWMLVYLRHRVGTWRTVWLCSESSSHLKIYQFSSVCSVYSFLPSPARHPS